MIPSVSHTGESRLSDRGGLDVVGGVFREGILVLDDEFLLASVQSMGES